MDKKNPMSQARKNEIIWIVIAVTVFFLGVFLLTHIYRDLRRQGIFFRPISQNLHRKKIAVAEIQTWMTFDFLNKSFGLAPSYLKDGLTITNKRYPNITIDRWAKDTHESPSALLDRINKLISDFSVSPASPETPTSPSTSIPFGT